MTSRVMQKAIIAAGGAPALARAWLHAMGQGKLDDSTPVQEEVSSEITTRLHGFLAVGTVTQSLDGQRAGRIMVKSAAFPEGPQPCDYVSPIAGAGYGFFAVPGVGATVVIAKAPYADPAVQNFWFGCLYAAGQRQIPGVKSQPYILGEQTQITQSEIKDNGEPMSDDPIVSYGIPNEEDVYRDNDLPDSFVLKHPAGHSISLTDKNTSERQINEIKLKTAGNKRVIMSDAPTESGGDNILLVDENSNQIRITATGAGQVGDNSIITAATGDIETYTKEGHSEHIISKESKGDYSITNAGKGNVDISSNGGEITLEAEKKITLKCGSCSITLDGTEISIKAPTVNLKGANGEVSIQGVTLLKHKHLWPSPPLQGTPTSVGR